MNAWSRIAVIVCASLFSFAACAQPAPKAKPGEFTPEVGQEGKDVVWVPTSQALVNKMLDMAKVTPRDYVIDLGSGDGRTVITAAKRGVKAHGIEYNPDMVELSKRNAEKEGVAARATFAKADLFESDFSQATVITMFLLPTINEKLKPKILGLKPGTRIVSNTFTMGDWEADETGTAASDEGSSYYRTALLWIVPAKVDGSWKSSSGEFSFRQEYQHVAGSVNAGGSSSRINGGRLRGEDIRFSAGGVQYAGKVAGDTITGTATTGGTARDWSATRMK
jgi:SAM-dependent methyltransferase